MGKRGPAPLPSKIINLRGGPSHYHRAKSDGKEEPVVPSNIPSIPATLTSSVAKKEWTRLTKELEFTGMLTNLDKTLLELYCSSYATWVDANKKVEKQGMVKILPTGYSQQNINLSISNKAEERMLRYMKEMGLTPSSRTNIRVPIAPENENKKKERFF